MENIIDKVSNEMKATISEWVRDDNIDIVNSKSQVVTPKNTIYTRYVKRIIDIVVSLLE